MQDTMQQHFLTWITVTSTKLTMCCFYIKSSKCHTKCQCGCLHLLQ